MTWPVLRTVLAVLLLVQAVSFAEAFAGNLETVLNFGARPQDFIRLQLYEMPETLPLSLPAALAVGIYTAVTAVRRERALVVLSAAGVGPARMIGFAFGIGLLGAGLTLGIMGEVLPRAKLAERALVHDMRNFARIEALDSADTGLVIQDVPRLSLIFGASGQLALAGDAEVLVLNNGLRSWRYAQAASATVQRRDGGEDVSLRLNAARAFGLPGEARFGRFDVEEVTVAFASEDYLPTFDAALRAEEVPRLTCLFSADLPCPAGAWAELSRSVLLAPVATLFALLAAAFDRILVVRGSGLLLALAASVGADVLTRAASTVVPGGSFVIAAALIAIATLLISEHSARLIRPVADD